ncbi:lysozyme [Streptomyces ochraceiscleroticus]|uniref:Lysozyme n=1 Tax=Streptomyces ochraceiscleroticus TaxID=47761 RepID=A0ABW1MCX3_9ACTN|nr:lysozyme [Streptomyces ochraceiscleroticus]
MRIRRCITLLSTLCTALAVAVPASAASASPTSPAAPASSSADTPHPYGTDHAGSTLRTHEGAASGPAPQPLAGVAGMDVSSHQGNVNWAAAWRAGARFAIVKATEGTGYRNPKYGQQYGGSYNAGMIRGAYHFALPNTSSGAAQANYFVDNGGGWKADGRTLPPALDIEYNPYGATCYGLSRAAMNAWIRDFSATVHARTGRYPMIYTATNWWRLCTGDNASFGIKHPLWIARYAASPNPLPAGWPAHTIWQYADRGRFPGDQNVFNGSLDQLRKLATG